MLSLKSLNSFMLKLSQATKNRITYSAGLIFKEPVTILLYFERDKLVNGTIGFWRDEARLVASKNATLYPL